jgi:hypothetical protein
MVLAIVFMFSAISAFAEHSGNGPCKAYETTCKADPTVTGATGKDKWKAMKTCISSAAAADSTNGPACTAAMAKHKGHDKGHDKD